MLEILKFSTHVMQGWPQMIDGGNESYWFHLQSWCALSHWFSVLLVWMFYGGGHFMLLKIMHGKHTTVRYLIMEFVRHYVVWDVQNTCMSSSSFFLFDMGFFLYALYLCYS